jgi:hypothetical protein
VGKEMARVENERIEKNHGNVGILRVFQNN